MPKTKKTPPADARRAEADISLDDIREMLWQAVGKKGDKYYLSEVFPSYLIFEIDGKYFKAGYSILDGEVQIGTDETEVEKAWVEARAAQDVCDDTFAARLRLDSPKDPEGSAWEVTICEPGFTKNGWYLPAEVLKSAAALFEGVDVNLFELPAGAVHVPVSLYGEKPRLAKNKAGWIDAVRFAADKGLCGVLHFLDSAKWLGKNLLSAASRGADAYGLSYDCPVRAKMAVIEGKTVLEVKEFLAADSVDIVTRPAAGGKFIRAIAARKEEVMDKETLWELITEKRPDLLDGKSLDTISDEEITGLARMAMEPPAPADANPGAGDGNEEEPTDKNALTKDDLALFRCELALDKAVDTSDLPDAAKARVRGLFTGKTFESEELVRAIAAEKDYLAAMQPKPADDPVIAQGVRVGLGTLERAQLAVDRTFGATAEEMKTFSRMTRLDNRPFFDDPVLRSVQDIESFDEIPPFTGLREMYAFFTGDTEVTGNFIRKNLPADLRASADITSATFTYVLGNTLGRRLVSEYRTTDFGEDLFISVRKPVKDFRQQEAVKVGYFDDLDTVDPETADYQEIAAVTDEESTYTLAQKGNLLTITRKTIINDDVSIVQRLVLRLGRAARRTHAQYVIDTWIDNDNCSDGTAWHTSGHGNLGSTALSITTALVAYKALGKMTEKDSAKRIGLLDDPSAKPILIHPVDLFDTADIVCNNEYYPGSSSNINDRNPMRNRIVPRTLSILTDTDDWGLILPANLVDHVEMGYLNGRQEPEMFVADSPQSEQVFVADKIRHKIRHEYAGTPVDYVGSYKAEV